MIVLPTTSMCDSFFLLEYIVLDVFNMCLVLVGNMCHATSNSRQASNSGSLLNDASYVTYMRASPSSPAG